MASDWSSLAPLRHTGFIKGGHFRQHLDRSLNEPYSQTGPRPFSKAQIEIEEGLQLQSVQEHSMASFNRPVRGNHVWATAWLQTHCNERGSARNESIQDHRHARSSAAQHHA